MNQRVLDPQAARQLVLDFPVRDHRAVPEVADAPLIITDRGDLDDRDAGLFALALVRRLGAGRLGRGSQRRWRYCLGCGCYVSTVPARLSGAARIQAGRDPPDDLRQRVRPLRVPQLGVRQLTSSLVRVDRDVADLGSLENTLQEHPARLISRLAKKRAALEANLALAGEADGDIHGRLIF